MNEPANLEVNGTKRQNEFLLGKGWHLIGFPFTSSQTLAQFRTSMKPSSAKIYSYDEPNGAWKSTDDGSLSSLEPGKGYWVFVWDSDGDGLADSEEPNWGTDVNNPDTDGDGVLDGAEAYAFFLYDRIESTDFIESSELESKLFVYQFYVEMVELLFDWPPQTEAVYELDVSTPGRYMIISLEME
ncbi:MAG: hypothetical protein ABIH99_00605 [Candidatus Micrarchaeota archaeon]